MKLFHDVFLAVVVCISSMSVCVLIPNRPLAAFTAFFLGIYWEMECQWFSNLLPGTNQKKPTLNWEM